MDDISDLIEKAKSLLGASAESSGKPLSLERENTPGSGESPDNQGPVSSNQDTSADLSALVDQLTQALEQSRKNEKELSIQNRALRTKSGKTVVTQSKTGNKHLRQPASESEILPNRREKSEKTEYPVIRYSEEKRLWFLSDASKSLAFAILTSNIYGWRWNPGLKAYSCGVASFVEKLKSRVPLSDVAEAALSYSRELASVSSADDNQDIQIPVPEGLEYLPYQRAGIAASRGRAGILIGDEMGLGKTVQAAGIINANPGIRSVLVIVPAFLCINWEKELTKWVRPVRGLDICRVQGKFWDFSTDIMILSYDSVGRWLDEIHSKEWDLIVCDECHYLKNQNTARTRRILGGQVGARSVMPVRARQRLLLTGTPILNHPAEILPLARFCDPQAFPDSLTDFKERYGACAYSAWNLRELHTRLRQSIMIRRLKKDVLKDLPPKRRQVIEVEADTVAKAKIAAEQKAYDDWQQIRENFRGLKEQKGTTSDSEYRNKLNKLREGTTAAWAALARLRKEVGIEKVPWVQAAIEEIIETGEKVIVFCHHEEVAKRLSQPFKGRSVIVNGKVSVKDKNRFCEQFQDPESGIDIFIGGLKSAGVGLTLTAATNVLFAELDWTPAVLSQAEDRAHRFGQLNPVLVQHIVLAESLDSHMSKKLILKQEVAERGLNLEGSGEHEMGNYGDM